MNLKPAQTKIYEGSVKMAIEIFNRYENKYLLDKATNPSFAANSKLA